MKKVLMSAVACALLSGSAYAGGKGVVETESVVIDIPTVVEDEYGSYYTLGLKAGTLGIGIDASMPLSDHFNIRGNINGLTYSRTLNDLVPSSMQSDFDAFGGNADGEINFLTAGILVDYYPFERAQFRLSAGVYYNGNEIGITGNGSSSSEPYDINGKFYKLTGTATATGNSVLDKAAPYIGIGWGNRGNQSGWSWSLDIGAMYQNIPSVDGSLSLGTGAVLNEVDAAGNPVAGGVTYTTSAVDQANLKKEFDTELAKLNQQIKDDENANYLKFWPVVMIGITYSF